MFEGNLHQTLIDIGLTNIPIGDLVDQLGVPRYINHYDESSYDVGRVKYELTKILREMFGQPGARFILYSYTNEGPEPRYIADLVTDRHTDPNGVWVLLRDHIYFVDRAPAMLFKLTLDGKSITL